MKYVIARAINGVTINGNENLLNEDGEVLLFDTREKCVEHCVSVGLDESYVWEREV